MKLRTDLAQQWKNWALAQRRMRIQILEQLLRVERTEYAALNKLEGADLAYRYGAETPAELAPFEADRAAWTEQVTAMFDEAELSRMPEQSARKAAA